MERLYEPLLRQLLRQFPAVAVLGPRQCGKTTLVQSLGKDWKYFDMERGADISLASEDPDLFLRLNPNRVVIDEAQQLPKLFPALRVAIDADRQRKGRYVLTGSSSPDLLQSVSESLAGRMAVIEMSPFLWAEVHPAPKQGDGLLSRLSSGEKDPEALINGLEPRADIRKVHHYWFRGGYPEPWLSKDPKFPQNWSQQYVQSYLYRDLSRLFPNLAPERFRQFIRLLAGVSGEVLNYSQIARALGLSQPTARDYFEIAHGTFLWRQIAAWDRRSLKRLVKHPKGYLRDSGLLHQILKIPDLDNLLAHPKTGHSWEGMVIEEVIRQFTALGTPIETAFYRTSAGAEVDLICEGFFGIIPFEIKHGQRVDLRDLRGIRNFMTEQNCPLGVVINNDEHPRRYTESLIGVPFSHL